MKQDLKDNNMDSIAYQKEVLRTVSNSTHEQTVPMDLMHGAIGACTETAELLDAIKKGIFYGKEFDRAHLIEEIGDVLWYLALAAYSLDSNLSEAMEKNIAKLKIRYPDKFSSEKAIYRNTDREKVAFK